MPLNMFAGIIDMVQQAYDNSLKSVLRHPIVTISITFLIIIPVMYLGSFLGGEFFPAEDEGKFTIKAQLPKGATVQASAQIISKIEKVVKTTIPELNDFTSQAGGENKGFDETEVNIRLVDQAERERSVQEIMYSIQPDLAKIPGAEIYVRLPQQGPGGGDLDITCLGLIMIQSSNLRQN